MLILVLRFFHILFSAAWFGAALWMAGDVRRTLALGAPHTGPLAERVRRASRLAIGTGWLAVLSGVALIFAMGGFGVVSPAIHIGLLLALIMIACGAAAGQTWGEIAKQLGRGETVEERLSKRLSALAGVFQLLWTLVLGLMVFRHVLF